jgi:hypothetical protein
MLAKILSRPSYLRVIPKPPNLHFFQHLPLWGAPGSLYARVNTESVGAGLPSVLIQYNESTGHPLTHAAFEGWLFTKLVLHAQHCAGSHSMVPLVPSQGCAVACTTSQPAAESRRLVSISPSHCGSHVGLVIPSHWISRGYQKLGYYHGRGRVLHAPYCAPMKRATLNLFPIGTTLCKFRRAGQWKAALTSLHSTNGPIACEEVFDPPVAKIFHSLSSC